MPKTKRNNKRKSQKIYKMRGCSKKMQKCKGGRTKKYLGGNMNNIPENIPVNTNAENPVYPNTGPDPSGFNFLNSQITRGGSCGMCNASPMTGGKKCSACKIGNCHFHKQKGRKNCRACKTNNCRIHKQKGGNNGLPYGENLPPMKGIPYPDGLVGNAWTSNPSTWGNSNHYLLNTYSPNDVSRQMVNIGAQPPFTGGGWKKNKKGGTTNGLFQDALNLGRSFTNGAGSAYNILRGYEPPVNPLPWKDQLKTV